MKKPLLLCLGALLVVCFSYSLSAQNPFEGGSDDESTFFIGVSPVVLQKESIEVNFINSLSSFWLAFREYVPALNGSRIANRSRFTRLDHSLQVNYGFNNAGRWDLGAELRYAHVRLDDAARNSPLKVLGSDTETGNSYHGLGTLGLRFRAMPFESLPELTAQASLHFPIAKDEDIREKLAMDRTELSLLGTFYQPLNTNTYYFLQGEWRTRFSNSENGQTAHALSGGAHLIFDVYDQRIYLFPGITVASTLSSKFNQLNHQLFGSIGVQYRPADSFSLFINILRPFIFDSGSLFTEWVRESYTGFSLGARYAM